MEALPPITVGLSWPADIAGDYWWWYKMFLRSSLAEQSSPMVIATGT